MSLYAALQGRFLYNVLKLVYSHFNSIEMIIYLLKNVNSINSKDVFECSFGRETQKMCLKIDLKLFELYFNILNFFNFKIRLLTFIFMSSHLQKKKARIKWSCKTRMQPSNVNLLLFKKKIKLKNLSFCKSLLNIQETLIYIFHRG